MAIVSKGSIKKEHKYLQKLYSKTSKKVKVKKNSKKSNAKSLDDRKLLLQDNLSITKKELINFVIITVLFTLLSISGYIVRKFFI